jgi:glc operon protein GlcG
MNKFGMGAAISAIALTLALPAFAQAPTPGPATSPAPTPGMPGTTAPAAPAAAPMAYGAPITLEKAKAAMQAAEAEAQKNKWPVAISIIDSAGYEVMFSRLDNTQYASIRIAHGKAKAALEFKRPSKALQDAVAAGGAGLRLLSVPDAMLLEGGVLVVSDGKIIGAIGVSGVTSTQDAQVAMAGADAAK